MDTEWCDYETAVLDYLEAAEDEAQLEDKVQEYGAIMAEPQMKETDDA